MLPVEAQAPVVDADPVQDPPLVQAAKFLKRKASQSSSSSMAVGFTDAAECLQASRATVSRRFNVVSQAGLEAQDQCLKDLFQYLRQTKGRTVRPIAFIERQAYDSTPALMRLQEGATQRPQRVKLYMVQSEWAMMLQNLEPISDECQEEAAGGRFFLLRGACSASPRVATRGNGETTFFSLAVQLCPGQQHTSRNIW